MLIVSLWLFMSVVLFGMAWYVAHYSEKKETEDADDKQLNIVNIINNVRNEKSQKKMKNVSKKLASKRAYNRLQLNEPLLFLDEESF
jgi:uncharacterized protein YlxW (UPF0749 family)